MKKNYYLIGYLLGLICAFSLGAYIGGKHFFGMFMIQDKYNGLAPLLFGLVCGLILSLVFDRKQPKKGYLFQGLIFPLSILIFTTVTGCGMNFIVNGNGIDFVSWVVKPGYWVLIFGIPSCIVVSGLYYAISIKK